MICYLETHCAQTCGVSIKSLCFVNMTTAFGFQLGTDPTLTPPYFPVTCGPLWYE